MPEQRWLTFTSTELVADIIFQNLTAAGQHFVAKGVELGLIGVFTDKMSGGIRDSFRDADNDGLAFFKRLL